MKHPVVHPVSAAALYTEIFSDSKKISSATIFCVDNAGKNYLITNWHVVTGVDPDSNLLLDKNGSRPDELKVYFISSVDNTKRFIRTIKLYDEEGKPAWKEHPFGQKVDVVAIPIENITETFLFVLNMSMADTDMLAGPGMHVSIIGFPLGITSASYFPIWKGGYIASDPDLDCHGLPLILIDATTRRGMSGSPVLATASNYINKSGANINSGRVQILFLGVYSGRENELAEIGKVWKANVIKEIISG